MSAPASPGASGRWSFQRLRARVLAAWRGLLDTPEGSGRLARGVAAGAFAAMVPAFGLHVLIALAAAWLARGSRAAAAAACLLIGNPLTHAATLPVAYELGRRLLPIAAVPGHGRLPPWLGALLPVAEEALVGGAMLGVAAGGIVTPSHGTRYTGGPQEVELGPEKMGAGPLSSSSSVAGLQGISYALPFRRSSRPSAARSACSRRSSAEGRFRAAPSSCATSSRSAAVRSSAA